MRNKVLLQSTMFFSLINLSSLVIADEKVIEEGPPKNNLKVIDDGISIQEKGVFTEGCYYGEDESISDHAPVLYNEVGTWNVAGPISHFSIAPEKNKPADFFFNHKFFTDDKGNLINRAGEKMGFLGTSEVVLITKVTKPQDIKDQLKKNKAALLDKIDKAAMESLDKLVSGDAPDNNKKIVTLNQLHLDAMAEVNNPQEEQFKNVIDLLSIYERGYAATTDHYIKRLEGVATKIKEFFNKNSNLNYMVLEEVPAFNSKTIAGESVSTLVKEFFQPQDPWMQAVKRVLDEATLDKANILHMDTDKLETIFSEAPERVPDQDNNKLLKALTALKKKEMLASQEAESNEQAKEDKDAAAQEIDNLLKPPGQLEDLNIVFFFDDKNKIATEASKTSYKKGMVPDVALVSRLSAPRLKQEISDYDSRFVPYCSSANKTCYVAVHMPFPDKDQELVVRCKDMKNLAVTLNQKGYNNISLLGDYNTYASRIARVCKDILPVPNGNVRLHTSKGEKGNSCGTNDGHVSAHNIDIMVKYNFEEMKEGIPAATEPEEPVLAPEPAEEIPPEASKAKAKAKAPMKTGKPLRKPYVKPGQKPFQPRGKDTKPQVQRERF